MMRNVLLIGRGTLAVQCLTTLKKFNNLPCIIICDDKDDGRDGWTKSLFKKCIDVGYVEDKNVFRTAKVNDESFIKKIKRICPNIDIIFSIQTRSILHQPFIDLAKEHVYNLHLSPLPKLRGVHTSSWAILDDLPKMGVTIHLIENKRIDAGPIVFQTLFPIKKTDTVWTLYKKCEKEGALLLQKTMKQLLSSNIKLIPQDERQATYHNLHELDYTNAQIPSGESTEKTLRFIHSRIFPPLQLPYFTFQRHHVFILKAAGKRLKNPPRKIVFHNKTYIIPCTDGQITVSDFRYKK